MSRIYKTVRPLNCRELSFTDLLIFRPGGRHCNVLFWKFECFVEAVILRMFEFSNVLLKSKQKYFHLEIENSKFDKLDRTFLGYNWKMLIIEFTFIGMYFILMVCTGIKVRIFCLPWNKLDFNSIPAFLIPHITLLLSAIYLTLRTPRWNVCFHKTQVQRFVKYFFPVILPVAICQYLLFTSATYEIHCVGFALFAFKIIFFQQQ